jgi:hypothetical protein
MPYIQQSDITNNSISFSIYETISFTTTITEFNGNVSATSMGIGMSTAMTADQPLAVKESGTGNTGWTEPQDWTVYDISITTTIPWANVSTGAMVSGTATASLTTGDLVGIYGPGTWALESSIPLETTYAGCAGSFAATIVVGGYGNGVAHTATQLFNGSGWAQGTGISEEIIGRGSAGSQNAALFAGGTIFGLNVISKTDLFNGSSWSTSGNLNQSKDFSSKGAGSQNAAMIIGGILTLGAVLSNSETFNGSVWNTSGNGTFVSCEMAVTGAQNAAVAAGGTGAGVGGQISSTQLFNGSTWTVGGPLSQAKLVGNGCVGSQNSALVAGGDIQSTSVPLQSSEQFNGSVWISGSNLSYTNLRANGGGSTDLAVFASGQNAVYAVDARVQSHKQNIYRKITFNNIKEAKNIGIVSSITGSIASVKLNGCISNILVTSSNIAITSAAQWVGTYLVLSRFSPNTSSTNEPASIIVKSKIEADDFVVGYCYSQTQSYIFGNNLYGLKNTRW